MAKPYKIGEFVLESKLGAGGMGVVFRARQVALQRWVALKLLSRPASGGSKFVQRFYREAQATAQLIHPNIIQTYTIGEHKGAPYFAMEYVEGCDLASILEGGALTLDESIEVVRAIAKALGLAAEHGIIHRDIKPANIMISKGGIVKVMDFGLAKATAIDESLTQDGQIIGTPTYMSPEQGMSKEVDARSDLYSLGCVFYECLTGNAPFEADNVPALIFKHLYEEPETPRKINPELPEEVEAIALKLMAKKPEERYQSSTDVVEDLAKIPINSATAELSLIKKVAAFAGTVSSNATSTHAGDEKSDSSEQQDPASLVEETLQPKPVDKNKLSLIDMPSSDGSEGSGVQAADSGEAPKVSPSKSTRAYAKPELKTPPPQKASESGHLDTQLESKPDFEALKKESSKTKATSDIISIPPPPPPSGRSARISSPNRKTVDAAATGKADQTSDVLPVTDSKSGSTAAGKPHGSSRAQRRSSRAKDLIPSFLKESGRSVSSYFIKDDDGRWTYDVSLGHCKYVEGLASEPLPGSDVQVGNLGDCPICSNWSKRSGCVLARTQEIQVRSRAQGADRAEELAAAWCAAGRFDRGITLMEDYIEAFPEDPGGYFALAQIYQRPDYTGTDRNRAIIMYGRFIELSDKHGGYTELEIKRARERMDALKRAGTSGALRPAVEIDEKEPRLASFNCFYRGDRHVFFGIAVVTRKGLTLAEAGEVDPDTGVSAADIGSPLQRATRIFRKMKSGKARSAERDAIIKQLKRLDHLSAAHLRAEDNNSIFLPIEKFQKISLDEKAENGYRILRIYAASQNHDLLFSTKDEIEAPRCALFLKRLTGA